MNVIGPWILRPCIMKKREDSVQSKGEETCTRKALLKYKIRAQTLKTSSPIELHLDYWEAKQNKKYK